MSGRSGRDVLDTDSAVAAAREATLCLLAARASGATICPSEVARALAGSGAGAATWRGEMPAVHAAVDGLLADQRVAISWKGERLPDRTGPYRITRVDRTG